MSLGALARTPTAPTHFHEHGLTDETRRCLARFVRWGGAPTIDGYCDLFAPRGTLLDADMEAPISGNAIRDSITRVLTLLPDFHFAPVAVVGEGRHLFVRAANRATLGERALAWEAVYALTLAGDRIAAGRRYYDRAALLFETGTFGVAAATSPADRPEVEGPTVAVEVAARAAAWNRHDLGALLAPLGRTSLRMSGMDRPLVGSAAIAGALARFAVRSGGLGLTAGAVAASAAGLAVEWVGRAGTSRFAMVEWFSPPGAEREWILMFDTMLFREAS